MSGIRVGDRVRTPQGLISWTVTRLGVSYGLPVAWMRSESGSSQRYRLDRLRVTESSPRHQLQDMKSLKPQRTEYEERASGAIEIDGVIVRGSDCTVEVVMEWQRPTERDADPNVPSVVTLAHWRDSETPGGFLWITASSDRTCEGAQLTRRSALELAAHLTNIAARMK